MPELAVDQPLPVVLDAAAKRRDEPMPVTTTRRMPAIRRGEREGIRRQCDAGRR